MANLLPAWPSISPTSRKHRGTFGIAVATAILLAATATAQLDPLSYELPSNLERTVTLPTQNRIQQISIVGGTGIIVGTLTELFALTNDLAVNKNWSPTGVGVPFCIQSDGKIVATTVRPSDLGQRHSLTRLNGDGSVDASFVGPSVLNSDSLSLNAVSLQPDGKILVGCTGASSISPIRNGLQRLNTDGSLDNTFDQQTFVRYFATPDVRVMIPLPDGRLLVAGIFEIGITNGGLSFMTRGVARLFPDGSVDTSFSADVGSATEGVRSMALQPDGKIIVMGPFHFVSGVPAQSLGRLNPTGSRDESFNANAPGFGLSMKVQSTGRIVITSNRVLRFFSDGRLDSSLSSQEFLDSYSVANIYAVELDSSDRVYFGHDATLYRESGQFRVTVPAASTPVTLEFAMGVYGP